jgi:hypothetical protein
MRSELVNQAVETVPSRFVLVHATALLTRKFHRRQKQRVQQSINFALDGIVEGRFLVAPDHVIHEGVLDLDTYNGFTGDAQCSYVKPQFVKDVISPAEWGKKFEASGVPCGQLVETT